MNLIKLLPLYLGFIAKLFLTISKICKKILLKAQRKNKKLHFTIKQNAVLFQIN